MTQENADKVSEQNSTLAHKDYQINAKAEIVLSEEMQSQIFLRNFMPYMLPPIKSAFKQAPKGWQQKSMNLVEQNIRQRGAAKIENG